MTTRPSQRTERKKQGSLTCCAPFWNLSSFKTVLHRFGISKWGAHFETVLPYFGTPSLAPFQNSAAPFWNINIFNINIYLHKFSKFTIKFFFILNDMIYLCCDKTWKLPSFNTGQAKLGITHIAQTWNSVIPPYTATKGNKW